MRRWLGFLIALIPTVALGAFSQVQLGRSSLPVPTILVNNAAISLSPKWYVNIHLFTHQLTTAQVLSLMSQVGATGARDSLNWDQIETSAGVYNWQANSYTGVPNGFDSWWTAICGAGYGANLAITYNNTLYDGGVGAFAIVTAGANTTAYSNFAVAGVNRAVNSWGCPAATIDLEEYNEPNLPQWTNSVQWAGGAYAVMAQTTSGNVKTAQPSAVTLTGGTAPQGGATSPATFMQQMVAGATMSSVDQYAAHPYDYCPGCSSNTPTPNKLITDLSAITAQMGAQVKSQPITEMNFPLNSLGPTCANNVNMQGVWTAWSMLTAVVAQVPLYAYYELTNDGIQCTGDSSSWGLFLSPSDTPSLGIKPSGTAFSKVTGCFASGTTYSVWQYPSLQTYEVTVNKSTGRCKALWFYVPGETLGSGSWPSTASSTFSEDMGSFSSATATDSLGNSIPLTISGSLVTLGPLSESVGPVFITLVN